MTNFEWRKKYAPRGYQWLRQRVEFEFLTEAIFPADVLTVTIESMMKKFELSGFARSALQKEMFTIVKLFPMQPGENLNHHDRLVPRFGLDIELRMPI